MSGHSGSLGGPWQGESTLHCYLLDYLHKRSFGKAAAAFAEEAGMALDTGVPIDAPQGLLYEWWSVFWDVFLANGGRRNNPHATVYAHTIANQKSGMRGPMQPPPHSLPPGAVPLGAPGQYPGAPGQRTLINGHPAGMPQPLPARMAGPGQPPQHLQRQMNMQPPPQQGGQPGPSSLPGRQQPPQSMMPPQGMSRPEPGQPVSREFVAECMHHCGLGGRSYESLNEEEQAHLHSFMQSPQAKQLASVSSQRMQQQQQAAAAQQAAMYNMQQQYPGQNGGNFYQGAPLPSPNPNSAPTPSQFQGSPPASAATPAMQQQQQQQQQQQPQQHYSAPANAQAARRAAPSRQGTGPAAHPSAPPTPELSHTPLNTASPRSRKRPRTDAPQQPSIPVPSQPNGVDPYASAAPPRPSSAASVRGQGVATPSPRMPPNQTGGSASQTGRFPPSNFPDAAEGMQLEGDGNSSNGLVGNKPPERRRSPMAPPPVPASASQTQISSTPAASPRNEPTPTAQDGLTGSPAHMLPNGVGAPQTYYDTGDGHAVGGELSFEQLAGGNGSFNLDDLGDFDINSFINIGDDFSGGS